RRQHQIRLWLVTRAGAVQLRPRLLGYRAVQVGAAVPPPGEFLAQGRDAIDVDRGGDELLALRARLDQDRTARVDDHAAAEVPAHTFRADPVGGDHEDPVLECPRTHRDVPNGVAMLGIAIDRVADRHDDDFSALERENTGRLGVQAIIADLNAEFDSADLEYREALTGGEIELLVATRSADLLVREIRRNMRFAIGADDFSLTIEHHGRVVHTRIRPLAERKDEGKIRFPGRRTDFLNQLAVRSGEEPVKIFYQPVRKEGRHEELAECQNVGAAAGRLVDHAQRRWNHRFHILGLDGAGLGRGYHDRPAHIVPLLRSDCGRAHVGLGPIVYTKYRPASSESYLLHRRCDRGGRFSYRLTGYRAALVATPLDTAGSNGNLAP